MAADQIPNETHQGSNIAVPTEAPAGPVLLMERQEAHDRFREGLSRPLSVLLRVTDVVTLVNNEETAASYFDSDTTVITTTTVNDRLLADLDWETELALIRQFQPDYHIPCDYPVYKEDDPLLRRNHVLTCLKGMIWMVFRLGGIKTQVIPLLKGETPHERRLCYQVFKDLGASYCAFYGTQYFTANIGFYQLRNDLRTIVSEAPNLEIMLIGLQAPHWLAQLPPQIVAAAGQRWIDEVQLRKIPYKASQQRYTRMEQNITRALSEGQMPIMAWAGSQEVLA